MDWKKISSIILAIVVFLGLILFINPLTFFEELSKLTLTLIIVVIFLFMIDLFCRVLRWWFLLKPLGIPISLNKLIQPLMAAAFLNMALAARLGELVKVYSLKNEYDVDYSTGFSVIVVEQVVNFLSLILATLISVSIVFFSGIKLNNVILNQLTPLILLSLILAFIALTMLFLIDPITLKPLLGPLPLFIKSKLTYFLEVFSKGLKSLRGNFNYFLAALAFSTTVWIVEGMMIWLLAIELIHPSFELPISLFASNAGNLTFIFPVLPGAVGQYEVVLAIFLTLSIWYTEANAVMVAVIDRFVKTFVLAVLGGFSVIKIGIKQIMKEEIDYHESKVPHESDVDE